MLNGIIILQWILIQHFLIVLLVLDTMISGQLKISAEFRNLS